MPIMTTNTAPPAKAKAFASSSRVLPTGGDAAYFFEYFATIFCASA
jgi:hypothetical protein